ncbi:MAG TPA: hypothetical protein VL098_14815 [Flavipsychrobacter sp.]|nr:hypothetical protein [Flavipsychrobacter sp.]
MVINSAVSNFKKEVIYEEREARLFEIMIEIHEMIAHHHVELSTSEDQTARARIKGHIAVLNALLAVIDKRIDEVKAKEYDKERREMMANRQFRIAAEAILQKETFEKIKELSLVNYKKLKDMKTELRLNKRE